MNLVVYGPEGSGKGTQAKLLGKDLMLPVFTAGDLVREAANLETSAFYEKAKQALLSGTYLPDEVMCSLIEEKLKKKFGVKEGFILDGFPRTIVQAKYLIEMLGKNDTQ